MYIIVLQYVCCVCHWTPKRLNWFEWIFCMHFGGAPDGSHSYTQISPAYDAAVGVIWNEEAAM